MAAHEDISSSSPMPQTAHQVQTYKQHAESNTLTAHKRNCLLSNPTSMHAPRAPRQANRAMPSQVTHMHQAMHKQQATRSKLPTASTDRAQSPHLATTHTHTHTYKPELTWELRLAVSRHTLPNGPLGLYDLLGQMTCAVKEGPPRSRRSAPAPSVSPQPLRRQQSSLSAYRHGNRSKKGSGQ